MQVVSTHDRAPYTREFTTGDKHCVFRVERSWFSIPATAVQEITLPTEMVSVPGSPPSLAGMCTVRSEFVPVLRLDSILQEPCREHDRDFKLLVINAAGSSWAILIDEVIALESLETLIHPDQRPDVSQTPVLGTATCREQIVRVLDPNSVFRIAHESLHAGWQALVDSTSRPGTTRSES